MKTKILLIVIAVLVLCCIAATVIPVVVSAEDTLPESGTVSESTVAPSIEINSEEAKEVIDVLENTSSKAEAILVLAERLGITAEDAETLINAVIDVGDEYFGQDQWWVAFKNNVQNDMQFWTVVVVAVLSVIAIVAGIFVIAVKAIPLMKKAHWKVSEDKETNKKIQEENSQTLGDLKNLFEESIKKEELYRKLVEEKEEYISQLETKLQGLQTKMVSAEMYNLRMLKLVCDRTAMPMQDKATIDLFYAKGIDTLKEELSAEDFEKIEKNLATLNAVNVVGDGK
jgi:hypothetical protein